MAIDVRRGLTAIALTLVLLTGACDRRAPATRHGVRAAPHDGPAAPGAWALPVGSGQQPDLATAPDGALLLSWTEPAGDVQRLRFARWSEGRWSAPRDVASGPSLGNTADTPHVRQTADGALWALWLRKRGEEHARDIVIARSADGGRTWSPPAPVNTDGTITEHGFASTWTEGRTSLGVAWLDGRDTAGGAHDHGHGMGGMHAMHADAREPAHATMLRSAVFAADLTRTHESAMDTATCDCCQTDVVALADGPRLVYRDRTADEVRDIALLRRSAGGWSAPVRVHADGWRIAGCPVNGPAVAAEGRRLAVAWYTMDGTTPTVRVARSDDGGATFARPVDLAAGTDVLGRVDVASDARGTWATWLTERDGVQVLHAARLEWASARPGRVLEVARLHGTGRGTGWPRVAAAADGVRAVWTDIDDGRPMLRGAVLPGP